MGVEPGGNMRRARRIGQLIVLTCCLLFVFVSTASAQTSTWKTYYQAGCDAYDKAHFVEAQHMFEAAVQEAQKSGMSQARLADSNSGLAQCLYAQGDVDRAIQYLRRALAIYESLDAKKESVAGCLNNLAAALSAQGSYD